MQQLHHEIWGLQGGTQDDDVSGGNAETRRKAVPLGCHFTRNGLKVDPLPFLTSPV